MPQQHPGGPERPTNRVRAWFGSLPTWAKILIILLLLALLPWLLIAGGIAAATAGLIGLLRGPLPRLWITNRASAVGALLLGLVGVIAGSALAAPVLNPAPAPPATRRPPGIAASAPATTIEMRTTQAPTTTASATTTTRRTTTTKRPAPPAPKLFVRFVSLPPAGQGNPATATLRTLPRAHCAIEVTYASGPSEAAGLDPKTASASGSVSWTWLVGTRTTPGSWPVTVSCEKSDDIAFAERQLTVRDTGKPG